MIKINNKTDLPYKILGQVIDYYVDQDKEDTLYVGKIDYLDFKYKNKKCRAEIRYGEKYVTWCFTEIYEILE